MKLKPHYRWSAQGQLWFLLPDAGSWFTTGFRRGFPLYARTAPAHGEGQ